MGAIMISAHATVEKSIAAAMDFLIMLEPVWQEISRIDCDPDHRG
jgi:hypothetical protein